MQYKEPKTLAEAAEMEEKVKEERARKRMAEKSSSKPTSKGEVESKELSTEDVLAIIKGKTETIVVPKAEDDGTFSRNRVLIVIGSVVSILALSGLAYAGYSYVSLEKEPKKLVRKKMVDEISEPLAEDEIPKKDKRSEPMVFLDPPKAKEKKPASKTVNVTSAEDVLKAINDWNAENEKRTR